MNGWHVAHFSTDKHRLIVEFESMVQIDAKNVNDVRKLNFKHSPRIQCILGQVRVHCSHIIDVKTKATIFSM